MVLLININPAVNLGNVTMIRCIVIKGKPDISSLMHKNSLDQKWIYIKFAHGQCNEKKK